MGDSSLKAHINISVQAGGFMSLEVVGRTKGNRWEEGGCWLPREGSMCDSAVYSSNHLRANTVGLVFVILVLPSEASKCPAAKMPGSWSLLPSRLAPRML